MATRTDPPRLVDVATGGLSCGLRKGGLPVAIDSDCEVGADIEAAEENGVIRTGISWVRWGQGDALEASGNGRTLNEIE